MDSPSTPAADGPVLYLTGRYPAPSHTFILREVAALRRQGVEIRTATVRRPSERDLIGPEERAEHAATFAVLPAARNPFRLLSDHVASALRAPGRYAGALVLALRTGRPGVRGLLYQLFYFAEAAVLARHAARHGAVAIHNHFADSSASLAMIAAHMAGLPFSYTLHGPAELFEPRSWRLDAKVARARVTVCISHFARSQAMLFSDSAHWDRLRIVHCGVEPERYADTPPPSGDGPRLVFVGRLTAIKGVRVLLDALAQARLPAAELTLVGDGDERAALEAEARRLGLTARFLGYRAQAEVAAELARADALVLPSFAEGVPVVLMEAMAAGRPVIATRVGGVAELVEDGASGFLVAPGDAAGLAGALARLAALPAEARAAMGAHGRETVRAEFDIDREAARLAALFRGAAGDGVRVI